MVTLPICALIAGGPAVAQSVEMPAIPAAASQVRDHLVAKAVIAPRMATPFFRKLVTSFPEHIIEKEDGSLENTQGPIHADDIVRIEKTADCISTHQGEHRTEFARAIAGKDGVELTLFGGMPAYASQLTVRIAPTLQFNVAFNATYPAPTSELHWTITKKELRLKSSSLTPGSRLRGWILVEFAEFERSEPDGAEKNRRNYRISGYFKPVIQDPEDAGNPDSPGGAKAPGDSVTK